MSVNNLGLFRGMHEKMNWLTQRQIVTSQNIANADTPSYRPRDIEEFSFKKALSAATDKMSTPNPAVLMRNVAVTDGAHINSSKMKDYDTTDSRKQRKTYEVAPAGNSVVIEEQMIRAGKIAMDYQAVTNLYTKNFGMLMASIGNRGGGGG